jgi:23S rRNA (uracil1939-C5)-methyltransferase
MTDRQEGAPGGGVPGDAVVLEALRPAAGGASVAIRDGVVHFVRGALPGETVEARVTGSGKRHRFASATAVLSPSPHRVEPPCPVYGVCGGCRLQHADYPFQLEMKKAVLRDALSRIGRIDCGEIGAVPSAPYGYRARGTFRIDGTGPALLREGSRELVRVERCPLMCEGINRLLPALKGLPGGAGVDELRILSNGEEASFAFRERPFDEGVAERLRAAGFSGGRFKGRDWGTPRLGFPHGGLRYSASPSGFLQANREVNRELAGRIASLCGEGKAGRVLDLYAGGGNFALPVAEAGCDVVAVEGEEESFRDLQRNISDNGLSARCRAVRSPVERFRPSGRFDLLLLDPPRAGLSPGARSLVGRIAAPRIAFVSCDPATLARDLAALSGRYRVESVTMYDFFPQTHHIEALAILASAT